MLRPALPLALVAAVLLFAGPAAADPGEPVPTWVPNGTVDAVAIDGSTAYIGGAFSTVAPFTGGSILLDGQTGDRRTDWPDVAGHVEAAVSDGSGGWYIGGYFTSVGGVPRKNLAHVLADRSVDPAWAPEADNAVDALILRGKRVIAGGAFRHVNQVARSGIAELDGVTGVPTAFATGVNGTVHTLVLGGLKLNPVLYVGGRFDMAGGVARRGLAAIGLTTGEVTAFDPNVAGEVFDIAIGPAGLYAAGDFGKVGANVDRRALAVFNPGTGAVEPWNARLGGGQLAVVYTLEVKNDTLYFGGLLSNVNDGLSTESPRAGAAAVDAATAKVTAWNPRIGRSLSPGPVVSLAVAGPVTYLGGDFDTAGVPPGQVPRENFAAVASDTGAVLPTNPRPHGFVTVVASDGDDVIVGGHIQSSGGVTRHNIAALDLETGEVTPFDPNVNLPVRALAIGDDRVWAGGFFTKVGGGASVRHGLASFDPETGKVGSFNQNLDGAVSSLAVDGATVYAGGSFTHVNTTNTRNRVAAFRDVPGTSGTVLTFDPDVNETVRTVSLAGGKLYIGGTFTALRGGTVPRIGVAAVDATTGEPTGWNPGLDGHVYSLKAADTTVLAAGEFKTVGGAMPRRGVAQLDAETGQATAWDAGLDSHGFAITSDGDQVFAGGAFTKAGTDPRPGLAAFDGLTGGLAPWNPALSDPIGGPVHTLAATPHGWLVVGGQFLLDGRSVRAAQIAAFRLPPAPPVDQPGSPGAGADGDAGGGGAGGGSGEGPGGIPPADRDRTAPLLKLTASRRRFRVGRLPKRGTTLSLKLSEPARVGFEVYAVTSGRRSGKGCRKATRANRKAKSCRLLVRRASFAGRQPAGTSRVAFTGQVGKRKLADGRYVMRATPTDAAGNAGKARSVTVRVVR